MSVFKFGLPDPLWHKSMANQALEALLVFAAALKRMYFVNVLLIMLSKLKRFISLKKLKMSYSTNLSINTVTYLNISLTMVV